MCKWSFVLKTNDECDTNMDTQSNGIGKRASSMAIVEFSTCFLRRTLMFEMRTIESEDCSWSHFEQIQLHALNYLDIPEIKNTVTADTVVLVMSMTFYGKLWSLLCCHLPDQVSMKASPNGRRVVSVHCCHRDNLSWYEVTASRLTSLNPASYAVDLESEERKSRNKGMGGRM
ncbi:hypothetical protein T10_3041 [Trichinella papuae]|uniref:Uncharacterized protein n=1 Tax=Trichinella papuae TaxID=268474 RepID=A0A0V1M2J0_9BILA|nr:hypothetical protein T10_3041 [Trichinella papuae]